MVLFLAGCGSTEEPVDLVAGEVRLVLPAGLNTIETHFIIERDVINLIDNTLTSNGLQADQVTQILPNRATLTSRDGTPLNFINEISVRAVSKADPDNSVEMFYLDFVQFNEDEEIVMLPSIADLSSILLDSRYDIEFQVTLRQFAPQTIFADFQYQLGIYN